MRRRLLVFDVSVVLATRACPHAGRIGDENAWHTSYRHHDPPPPRSTFRTWPGATRDGDDAMLYSLDTIRPAGHEQDDVLAMEASGRPAWGDESTRLARSLAFAEPIVALGVAALARAFDAGDACPRHACEVYLDRIARHDAVIGAYVAVDAARARRDAAASARRWARGEARSAIDGVPVGIKANIAVQGLPWTAGLQVWRDRTATKDAACVTRLRDSGAVILGTLNMDAGALGAMTDNPWWGRTHNPYRLDRSAGGSSGGPGAAVAAGLCAAALGTDTMGSVRIPAAACGLYAIVPPMQAIDRGGVVPLAPSFDRVGILARSLPDLRTVLGAYVDLPARPTHDDLPLAIIHAGPRSPMDASVRSAHAHLLARLTTAGWQSIAADLHDYDAQRTVHQLLLLVEVEGATIYRDILANHPEGLGPQLCALLRWGASLSAERRAEAAQHLIRACSAIDRVLTGSAGLLSPTTPHAAAAFDEEVRKDTACFTAMASITGLPAIVLPVGGDDTGLPHSLQLVARTTDEALHLAERMRPCLEPVVPPQAFRW